ncbi:MAG TPA: hypothetical protein PKL65_11895 [Bacteroidales bacterium]|jgi:hypothetical protein|nr:hypothetical protein [Bacteroidales bacterium]HNR42924.1 hypothetical protein [Bacteroidales bacterium]HPM18054.1 hypothetical protein [Bacteroidales bacterium]HQG76321.1 hypothetical protein [Bacteroidales bacterium]
MTGTGKYDKTPVGALAGFILPLVAAFLFWFFSPGDLSIPSYFRKIIRADILTHIMSLSVTCNLVLFLVFNRLDMLQASRGVLGMTIAWAVLVFTVKFLL